MRVTMQVAMAFDAMAFDAMAAAQLDTARLTERDVIGKVVERARMSGWDGGWAGIRVAWLVEVLEHFEPTGKRVRSWTPGSELPDRAVAFLCRAEMDF